MEQATTNSLTLEQIQAMTSDQRIEKIMLLQHKMQETGELAEEEIREGIRLLQVERVSRAGGKGGSATKKENAVKAMDLSDF